MSDTNQGETFTERVDVSTRPDGAFIGAMEIDVISGSHPQEEADALRAEARPLRARVWELEAELAGAAHFGEAVRLGFEIVRKGGTFWS